jgi:tRNA uridine 5-carboxymethylaminomethyl modification enzyme
LLTSIAKGWVALGFNVQLDGVLRRYWFLSLFLYSPLSHVMGSSGFDLLRYPTLSSSDLKAAIPSLSDVDPRILARIDVEGTKSRIYNYA